MALLVLLSVLTCTVVGSAIGARLLGLARETRQLPELLIGTGVLVYSGVALPSLLIMGLPSLPVGVTRLFQLLQQGANFTAMSAVLLFTWRVFRPATGWARALVVAGIAVAAVASWGTLSVAPQAPGASAMPAAVRPYVSLMIVVWGGAFLWTGIESLRFHAKMRRRLALGAGDPLVCNRFLLWAIWGLACGALDLVNLAYNFAGFDFSRHPAPLLTISASCLLSSAVWYLAFLAPESYELLVLRRART
jgi:hypothetical protein